MVCFYHGYEAGVWFIDEVTEGETPVAPNYLNLAQRTEVTVSQQPAPNVVALSGSVDNATIQKGIDNPIITLTLNPNQGSAQTFLNKHSSSDTSFTMLIKIESPDVTFARVTGCKVKRRGDSVTIYPNAGVLETSLEIWGWTILATDGTPASLEAPDPSVINWSDISLTKNAGAVTDWWNFSWTVDNDIFRNRDSDGVTTCLKRGRRAVSGSWTKSSGGADTGIAELDEAKDATPIDLVFNINGDGYTFLNSAYQEVTVNHPITDMVGITQSFVAGQFTIT